MLFPTPVIAYSIPEADRLNAALLREIAARQDGNPGVVRSNRKGWHSQADFFARKEPGHGELAQAIIGAVRDATARMAPKGRDTSAFGLTMMGWVNVNPPGAYNVPHDHPGSFWSGAYYVKNDKPSGDAGDGGTITFIDARSAPAGQPLVRAPALTGLQSLHPQPGTLLLFPSTLKHLVSPNDTAEDRISVAFNVFIQPPAAAAPARS